jgi:predicted helicase
MSISAVSKFKSIRDFPELVEYLGDELDWPIETDDFEEMTFEYSAAELGLDEKTAPKFLEIRRLRPLDNDQPWGIFFIRFDDSKLPVVALRRLLSKLVLNKRSTNNSGDRASWHESDLLLISQTGNLGTQSISFAHFAANPVKTDLPILKVLGWDDDDTGLKIDYVIETLREKLIWPDDPSDSEAWRAQWRDAFTLKNREVIQSSKDMAERLGHLALSVRTRLREVLAIESEEGPIHKLMSVFKENLISDLDTDSFSDMYAQTIAYGLLSARIINPKANTADAAHTQIPITNPFLRDLMETFLNVGGRSHRSGVGLDFDELGINEVVDLLDNTNMEAVLRDFGDRNQKEDPVMHFFEGFLKEYDSKIRKDRGVFYTPQPVVSFIVRSVDEQLRTEFGLEDGLADTTTWGELAERTTDLEIPEGTPTDQPFVQILDPATGTGTFPVEVIDLIYKTMTAKWQKQGNRDAQIKELWNEYVPEHLLPRLYGYELMMAPYAIAHMKIGLKLYETGYRFKSDERARVYLTNALEPAQDNSGTFAFAIPALAREADAVNSIKLNNHFSVIIGNPPYFGEGGLSQGFIGDLMDDYKKEPGGKVKLKERNPKWLNDLYVKFIRLSSHQIERSGIGILGFITNHSYLDNPTFRGMRWHLLDIFKKIHVLDLHGNSKKKEITPEGKPDKNVFDIQQGVSIIIGSKKRKYNPEMASVMFGDLWGERNEKYITLQSLELSGTAFSMLESPKPHHLFVKRDYSMYELYKNGFSITEFMPVNSVGIVTARDKFTIDMNKEALWQRIGVFVKMDDESARDAFCLGSDVRDWTVSNARADIGIPDEKFLAKISYRPFDQRWTYYTGTSRGFLCMPRSAVMNHMLDQENFALSASRQNKGGHGYTHVFCHKDIAESSLVSNKTSEISASLPLYLSGHGLDQTRRINFAPNLYKRMKALSICPGRVEANEIQVFDYIYGVLHCPAYRETFAEFLAMDYPRIPWPKTSNEFWHIANKGSQLRGLHLMQAETIGHVEKTFSGNGDNFIGKTRFSEGRVWINDQQYFDKVSEISWTLSIGAYQPAQKWLKDRKGKKLSSTDILHYQKILKILSETSRVMNSIEMEFS